VFWLYYVTPAHRPSCCGRGQILLHQRNRSTAARSLGTMMLRWGRPCLVEDVVKRSFQIPLLVALLSAALFALSDCGEDEPTEATAPEPPLMPHGSPNEAAGQMCVVCHTCGDDGTGGLPAPIIDRTHDVCNACHAPDGTVVVHGDDTCEWQMDCEATPPVVNCDDCHTVQYVNDLCEACHDPASVTPS
jgi:hypothetical protein